MARFSGGPTVHRAIKGPRLTGVSRSSPQGWKAEVVTTLRAIQEVRQACDNTEVRTVRYARKAGLSWAEIATALGVSRQAVWERWHELDETLPKNDAWGPSSLNDPEPESPAAPESTPA
ncbi:helix-turn-helix domain-containing protein [Paenarthrobacter sp. TA1.8]|uniref:helix-turn-helix domain-containing protein n=1 Tax=Paenarthrobacter sp. TA1.8 TaxID=3400219 RepID=UPI003B431428